VNASRALPLRRPARLAGRLGIPLLLAAAVAWPFLTVRAQPYLLQLSLNILIFAVLAVSWDLLARTGQLSLAHAAFYGLGAYTSALLATRLRVPVPLAMLAGGGLAVVCAVGLGLLTLRLRGIYFAIATLAFTETLRVVAKQVRFFGAATGLVVPPLVPAGLVAQYLVILAVLLAALLASWLVNRSRWSFAFTAIRTNEAVAAVMGVDVVRFKVAAFALSAFFAGLTGAYYAHVFLFINPFEVFSLAISVGALVAPIFGGLYTTAGPLLGAVVLRAGEEALRATIRNGYLIIYGAILAVVVLFMPRGLLGVLAGSRRPPLPAVKPATRVGDGGA
jgi:branched-chain amino acid transport system permease protein